MNQPLLLPVPRKMFLIGGTFTFGPNDCLLIFNHHKEELYTTMKRLQACIGERLRMSLPIIIERQGGFRAGVAFEPDPLLPGEAYTLNIRQDGIRIRYRDGAGAFHAVSTLKQLLIQYGMSLPCLRIEDVPDFQARGIMLDISRAKIPTRASLYNLVDLMADLKMNQLQLYIEGFSFAYTFYPQGWQDGTPLTGEDIWELNRYCKERYIDLVPNQNSFGHMAAWLSTREFRELAEKPDGFEVSWQPGKISPPGTLNPGDSGSLNLVANMAADLLPYFTSGLFNVGCDETYELGLGRSKDRCGVEGIGHIYLEYLLKINEIVKAHDKRMMFWGDIVNHYPELISQLPKDVIALEWGYEAAHPYEERGKAYQEAGVDFYVCPGTSSWLSLSGRMNNMEANLLNAAVNGKQFGAAGFLITDWGDNGHWQYPFVSYPGFAYGAALSWAVESNGNADITTCLNRYVFQDRTNRMGDLVMELGNYYLMEKIQFGNYTGIAMSYFRDFDDLRTVEGYTPDIFAGIERHVLYLDSQLCAVDLHCMDAELILEEFRNAVRFIVHGCRLGMLKLLAAKDSEDDSIVPLLEKMIQDIVILTRKHENLWLARNRHGGLTRSIKCLANWKETYEMILKKMTSKTV